jgi:undecaprenyl diphosphate synthase
MNHEKQFCLPRHVAIVMDGNGRWAKNRLLPRVIGHRTGASAARKAIQFCLDNHIEVLTLFALSIENFLNRPSREVDLLLNLFLENLQNNIQELNANNIRIRFIGDRTNFQKTLQQTMDNAEQLTCQNSKLQLVIAINYSGRWEIVETARKIAERVRNHELEPAEINQKYFASQLCLNDLPEPDLLIRTSGEQRISNFLLWHFAYTEMYFPDIYWPDFDAAAFQNAIDFYRTRQRRFGYTDEQLDTHYAEI